jgi:diamine N-acetyltransferase
MDYRNGESGARPLVNIVGEMVALGPLRRDLLPLYLRWANDMPSARNLNMLPPHTLEQETAWYDKAVTAGDEKNFTVYEVSTWRPIGTTGLMSIEYRHRRAEFGILIGERDSRGKGYGTETTRLVLDYAFTALGLHNVMLRAFSFNRAGLRAYEKAGFREFGRRHECYSSLGRLWDDVHMECLAADFTSPVLAATLAPDYRS